MTKTNPGEIQPMTQSLVRLMNYPIWAHAEYETDYDCIRELADSLSIGDVIQINDRKAPLRIDGRNGKGTLSSDDPDALDDTVHLIKQGDGRKYGTYYHRKSSKDGIGKLAVIYRDDGSITPYTERELAIKLGGRTLTGLHEVTYEVAETTVRPIPTADHGTPRVSDQNQTADDDAEAMAKDLNKHFQQLEAQAMGRYQRGESVEDIDDLTRETDFETKTVVAEMIVLPGRNRDRIPRGTIFFREHNAERDGRNVIPFDSLESVVPIDNE